MQRSLLRKVARFAIRSNDGKQTIKGVRAPGRERAASALQNINHDMDSLNSCHGFFSSDVGDDRTSNQPANHGCNCFFFFQLTFKVVSPCLSIMGLCYPVCQNRIKFDVSHNRSATGVGTIIPHHACGPVRLCCAQAAFPFFRSRRPFCP